MSSKDDIMKKVEFFEKMTDEQKRLYKTTADIICRGLTLPKSSYGGMHHTDGQGVLFNVTNELDERLIFKEDCCWFYLDFDGNTLESIDDKLLNLLDDLVNYNVNYGAVFEIEPVDGNKGFYLGKIDFKLK